ncbi:MAG TPA: immunity 53 family protein [Acidobacteriaceae bacterium]|nr:immunity 53 family protein [Acidobacteriaceae bacterium]
MPNNLEWLEAWYQQQCDGDWENRAGIRLESLCQPGWRLTISLEGTSAENASPNRLRFDTSGEEWLDCTISGERFEGAGDPRRLEQIIGVFRKWVEAPGQTQS